MNIPVETIPGQLDAIAQKWNVQGLLCLFRRLVSTGLLSEYDTPGRTCLFPLTVPLYHKASTMVVGTTIIVGTFGRFNAAGEGCFVIDSRCPDRFQGQVADAVFEYDRFSFFRADCTECPRGQNHIHLSAGTDITKHVWTPRHPALQKPGNLILTEEQLAVLRQKAAYVWQIREEYRTGVRQLPGWP